MKRHSRRLSLAFIIIAGVFLAAVACGGPEAATDGKQAETDAAFQQFIARYLNPPATANTPARVLVKDLPAGFDVPMPLEAVLVGSIARDEGFTQVLLDVPGMTPEETIEAFQAVLEEADWRLLNTGFTPGGVNPSDLPRQIILLACGDRDQWLQVSAASPFDSEEGPTDVRLMVSESGPPNTGCGRSITRSVNSTSTGFIFPNLDSPEGVVEQERSSIIFMGTSVTTFNILDTDLSPERIANHYVEQLRDLGWEMIESGVTDEAAWSHWRFTDRQGRGWIAVLTVSQTTPDTESATSPRVVVLEGIPLGHSLPSLPPPLRAR